MTTKPILSWLRKRRAVTLLALALLAAGTLPAGDLAPIRLNPPTAKRGLPLLEALAVRASARAYSQRELSLQDLSDLLWSADGVNRPAENKTTAPSAMNAHDIRIYVFLKQGVFLYDAPAHVLQPVASGDFRAQVAMPRPPRPVAPAAPPLASKPESAAAPVPPSADPAKGRLNAAPGAPSAPPAPPLEIVLVSDGERFRHGSAEQKAVWGALDAGIVSQNISLFCAATGLRTRPKASINKERLKEILQLGDAQIIFLNHPVGYPE